MKVLGAIGGLMLAVVVILGLTWIIRGNDLAQNKVMAPREEQVRRETFEQSKAYNSGMIQELENMQFQYEQASPEHKDALKSIILHRVSEYGEDKLPSGLRSFVSSLHNQ